METRKITQLKLYGLVLNTFGRAEDGRLVAVATSREALEEYYNSQLLEKPETIDGWRFSFKEGPLRHLNPSGTQDAASDIYGHGIIVQWVNENEVRDDVYRVNF